MLPRFATLTVAVAGALGSLGASAAPGGPAGSASQTGTKPCEPTAAHTIAADPRARVFSLAATVYGCSLRSGKRYRLGQTATCIATGRVWPVALAGDLAGYGIERCGVDTGFSQVVVRNLPDGKQLRSEDATSTPIGPESYVSVNSLALASDGGVAWIAEARSIVSPGQLREVHRADKAGLAVLDSGAGIDPSSLRLHGSKLTWKHGRSSRSAQLR